MSFKLYYTQDEVDLAIAIKWELGIIPLFLALWESLIKTQASYITHSARLCLPILAILMYLLTSAIIAYIHNLGASVLLYFLNAWQDILPSVIWHIKECGAEMLDFLVVMGKLVFGIGCGLSVGLIIEYLQRFAMKTSTNHTGTSFGDEMCDIQNESVNVSPVRKDSGFLDISEPVSIDMKTRTTRKFGGVWHIVAQIKSSLCRVVPQQLAAALVSPPVIPPILQKLCPVTYGIMLEFLAKGHPTPELLSFINAVHDAALQYKQDLERRAGVIDIAEKMAHAEAFIEARENLFTLVLARMDEAAQAYCPNDPYGRHAAFA